MTTPQDPAPAAPAPEPAMTQCPAPMVSYVGDLSAKREFLEAFAKAQGQFAEIENNCIAHIRSRKPGVAPYSFRYADLAEIIRKTRPALSSNGLVLSQTVRQLPSGDTALDTLLEHVGGCGKISTVPLPSPGTVDDETFAGTLSRFRRYMAQALLNVSGADPVMPPPEDGGDWDDVPAWEPSPTVTTRPVAPPPAQLAPAQPPERERPPRKARAAEAAPSMGLPLELDAPVVSRAPAEPLPDDATPASSGERNFLLAKAKTARVDLGALLLDLTIGRDPATLDGLTKGEFRAIKSRLPL